MKRVQYTIVLPDDMEVDSIVINLVHRKKTGEQYRRTQDGKRGRHTPNSHTEMDEPDEGLLYDELY